MMMLIIVLVLVGLIFVNVMWSSVVSPRDRMVPVRIPTPTFVVHDLERLLSLQQPDSR